MPEIKIWKLKYVNVKRNFLKPSSYTCEQKTVRNVSATFKFWLDLTSETQSIMSDKML